MFGGQLEQRSNSHLAFKLFWLWTFLGCLTIGLVFYFSLVSNTPDMLDIVYADKLKHLFAYSVLMGWFSQLYQSTKHQVIWAAGFCLMGVFLEFLQAWGGQRYFAYTDMVANITGISLGWWLSRGWCAGWLHRVDQALFR